MATRSEAGEPEELTLFTLFIKEKELRSPSPQPISTPTPLPLLWFPSFFFLLVSVPPSPSGALLPNSL